MGLENSTFGNFFDNLFGSNSDIPFRTGTLGKLFYSHYRSGNGADLNISDNQELADAMTAQLRQDIGKINSELLSFSIRMARNSSSSISHTVMGLSLGLSGDLADAFGKNVYLKTHCEASLVREKVQGKVSHDKISISGLNLKTGIGDYNGSSPDEGFLFDAANRSLYGEIAVPGGSSRSWDLIYKENFWHVFEDRGIFSPFQIISTQSFTKSSAPSGLILEWEVENDKVRSRCARCCQRKGDTCDNPSALHYPDEFPHPGCNRFHKGLPLIPPSECWKEDD